MKVLAWTEVSVLSTITEIPVKLLASAVMSTTTEISVMLLASSVVSKMDGIFVKLLASGVTLLITEISVKLQLSAVIIVDLPRWCECCVKLLPVAVISVLVPAMDNEVFVALVGAGLHRKACTEDGLCLSLLNQIQEFQLS